MHWVDLVILAVIALSALISLVRGFVKESISLGTWVIAGLIAITYFRTLSIYLEPYIESPTLSLAVAFAVLFVATLIVGAIINFMVSQMVSKTGLSGTDKMLGVVFGAARGVLIVAMVVLFAGLTPMPQESWWQSSALIPYFQNIAAMIQQWMPEDIASRFAF